MMIIPVNHHKASSIRPNCLSSCRYYGFYSDVSKEGELVGIVGIHFRAWYCSEICHLFVKDSYRCKGVGTELVAHALMKVKTPLAVATVRENNLYSKKIFMKLGFKEATTFINPNTGNVVKLLFKEIK